MPIRFRCVYCDKLLGIGRRKAGAVVNCPHCGEKLIVPTPEADDPAATASEEDGEIGSQQEEALAPAAPPPLFERVDFDELLEPAAANYQTTQESPAPLRPTVETEYPAVPQPFPAPPYQALGALPPTAAVQQPPPQRGIFLSRSKATWLTLLVVVLLAAAFAGGFFVSRLFPHK